MLKTWPRERVIDFNLSSDCIWHRVRVRSEARGLDCGAIANHNFHFIDSFFTLHHWQGPGQWHQSAEWAGPGWQGWVWGGHLPRCVKRGTALHRVGLLLLEVSLSLFLINRSTKKTRKQDEGSVVASQKSSQLSLFERSRAEIRQECVFFQLHLPFRHCHRQNWARGDKKQCLFLSSVCLNIFADALVISGRGGKFKAAFVSCHCRACCRSTRLVTSSGAIERIAACCLCTRTMTSSCLKPVSALR